MTVALPDRVASDNACRRSRSRGRTTFSHKVDCQDDIVVDTDHDRATVASAIVGHLALALASRRAAHLPEEIQDPAIWRDFSRSVMRSPTAPGARQHASYARAHCGAADAVRQWVAGDPQATSS
jgi:hypothetical protein